MAARRTTMDQSIKFLPVSPPCQLVVRFDFQGCSNAISTVDRVVGPRNDERPLD